MRKMDHQSCSLFMVATQVKFQTSHGTHVKIGSLLVLPRIIYYKSGRWLKTSTMMKMTCLEMMPPKALRILIQPLGGYCNINQERLKRCLFYLPLYSPTLLRYFFFSIFPFELSFSTTVMISMTVTLTTLFFSFNISFLYLDEKIFLLFSQLANDLASFILFQILFLFFLHSWL